MALDVHLSNSDEKAPEVEPTCSLEYSIHERIFWKDSPDGLGPFLTRMKDYYADAKYTSDELDGLRQELKTLVSRYQHDVEAMTLIDSLLADCAEAGEKGYNLYCFCD